MPTQNICKPILLLVYLLASSLLSYADNNETLYKRHCAGCHGENRLGAMGPALLPENLSRLKKTQARSVIKDGRPASQMPGFKNLLSEDNINSLIDYIYASLPTPPVWNKKEIQTSQIIYKAPNTNRAKPKFNADPLNLFIVVELGDHHASLLDGDRFEVIHRFPTRFAVHGGPKFSPDGRFVYFTSRDGWISKYDIYNLELVAEIRAGINTRNAAISYDGRYVAVGNYLPHSLVILDAQDLTPIEIIPSGNSRVSAVYTAPPRHSFIVALKDIPEVWEVPYNKNNASKFEVRKIYLNDYLDDFFFDQKYQYVIGTSRPLDKNAGQHHSAQVIDLNKGSKKAGIDLAGMPHLGSGISWKYKDTTVLASPNLKTGEVSIIDMRNWKVLKKIQTLGPGFFMRSHKSSPYAWVDVFFGPHKNKVHIIDKKSLEIVKTIAPVESKTAAHVEFTKDGRYALLSIWDTDGAVIIYDANTLKELRRLPMNKPSGKYNIYNKTRYIEGTSH